MTQESLFHESLAESLRTAAMALGGFKKAGVLLWPELSADRAGRDLADCLQAGAARKLSLEQIELLIKRGRSNGCHAPMTYLADMADYEAPVPRDPETAIEKERRDLAKTLKATLAALNRLEAREARLLGMSA